MTAQKINIRDMTLMAVFAAVLAVLSQLAIPMPSGVPVTLQTFALALIGYTLGAKRGAIAVLVYLLLGAVGVPVFANFKAGAAALLGPTGGFLWAFWLAALFCGLKREAGPLPALASGFLGLLVLYAAGVFQFILLTGNGLVEAVFMCVAPFVIKDILSIVLGYVLAQQIRRRLPL